MPQESRYARVYREETSGQEESERESGQRPGPGPGAVLRGQDIRELFLPLSVNTLFSTDSGLSLKLTYIYSVFITYYALSVYFLFTKLLTLIMIKVSF
jgi:hypothetical protein